MSSNINTHGSGQSGFGVTGMSGFQGDRPIMSIHGHAGHHLGSSHLISTNPVWARSDATYLVRVISALMIESASSDSFSWLRKATVVSTIQRTVCPKSGQGTAMIGSITCASSLAVLEHLLSVVNTWEQDQARVEQILFDHGLELSKEASSEGVVAFIHTFSTKERRSEFVRAYVKTHGFTGSVTDTMTLLVGIALIGDAALTEWASAQDGEITMLLCQAKTAMHEHRPEEMRSAIDQTMTHLKTVTGQTIGGIALFFTTGITSSLVQEGVLHMIDKWTQEVGVQTYAGGMTLLHLVDHRLDRADLVLDRLVQQTSKFAIVTDSTHKTLPEQTLSHFQMLSRYAQTVATVTYLTEQISSHLSDVHEAATFATMFSHVTGGHDAFMTAYLTHEGVQVDEDAANMAWSTISNHSTDHTGIARRLSQRMTDPAARTRFHGWTGTTAEQTQVTV